ncbi:MAG: hypothetical protein ACOX1P_04000 [Thermoguttaceae bacterium]|jgi:hypothetical protein
MKCLAASFAMLVVFSPPIQAGETPKTPAEFLKFFSYFTGEWKGTSKSADATHVETWSIQETPDKQCHIVFATTDGKPSGQSLWGFDPKNKRWKGTYFGGDGAHGTDTIRDAPKRPEVKPGDTWKSTVKGITLDGKATSASEKWIIVDKDTATIELTDRTEGDEKKPDVVTTMKRQ